MKDTTTMTIARKALSGALLPVLCLWLAAGPAIAPVGAEGIRVTQVDVNNLLLRGEIRAYVSMGESGSGELGPGDFRVTEADGSELEVVSVDATANIV